MSLPKVVLSGYPHRIGEGWRGDVIRAKATDSPPQFVCCTDGGWDDTAMLFSSFFRHRDVAEYGRQKGFDVVELYGTDAVRANWDRVTASTTPAIAVCGGGHGDSTRFTGASLNVLLEPANFSCMNGRVGEWMSCSFGQSWRQRRSVGQLAEISYVDTVWFTANNPSDPERDDSGYKHFECFHAPWRALIEGKTFREACMAQIAKFEYWLAHMSPMERYYGEINFGILQQVVASDDSQSVLWNWLMIQGVTQPQIVFSIDDVPKLSWDYIAGSQNTYTGQISINDLGVHKLKTARPDGKSATIEIEIVPGTTPPDVIWDSPKNGDKITQGQKIALSFRA